MMSSNSNSNYTTLSGLTLADSDKATRKIENFLSVDTSQVCFVFDFDRTLTTHANISIWRILHALLPEDGQKLSRATRDKYLAMEAAGILSAQDSHHWSTSELTLHAGHGTNMSMIEEAIKNIELRKGVIELFDLCNKRGIPTVIVSAGIRDVIELITTAYNMKPSLILSVKLRLAEDGSIIGWDNESMIHPMNKQEKASKEISLIHQKRPYTILVGDTLHDVTMVEGSEKVLRIRVPEHDREKSGNSQLYLERSFAHGYDGVLEGDLLPLLAFTQRLSNK